MVIEIKKIKIDSKILKAINKIAKNENTTEDKVLNDVVKIGIEKIKNESTIKKLERITNGKIKIANKDTYNPSEKGFESIAGIIEAPTDFNVLEAVEDSRNRKWK